MEGKLRVQSHRIREIAGKLASNLRFSMNGKRGITLRDCTGAGVSTDGGGEAGAHNIQAPPCRSESRAEQIVNFRIPLRKVR